MKFDSKPTNLFEISVIVPGELHKGFKHHEEVSFVDFFNISGGVINLWIGISICSIIQRIINLITFMILFFREIVFKNQSLKRSKS